MTRLFHKSAITALVLAGILRADVTVPAVIADHMVVQRDRPVHVWGNADPAEKVTVQFRGASQITQADELGRWSIWMAPGAAGGPFTLEISGKNTIRLQDVLVGDVWIASGQSNMEFKLSSAENAEAEISAANLRQIRLFTVQREVSQYPLNDVKARPWEACTPASAASFSAVAYFFGRQLQQKLSVPIGLIHSSWGGTPAEAWTSMDALGSDAALMPVFAEWGKMSDGVTAGLKRQELEKRQGKSGPWRPNERLSWSPSGLYNAMVAPLTPFPIKGAIWYQGESNTAPERAPLYARLFQTMIRDWRNAWAEGDFPFLYVQIANFKAGGNAEWPEVREAQLETLSLRNTGMAVTIDIGNPDNIHPTNKQDVGKRLALAARAVAYGEKLEYSGPLFREAAATGDSMRIWFDHTGTGLMAKGGPLKGFELAGADGKYKAATAQIDNNTLVVSSPGVHAPRYVRYGWSDSPDCNLYNQEGLPASPFRSR
jgi:sialate O-acetylesterase